MLAPETIRAYQHQRAVAMIARSIVGAPRLWTDQDDRFALPTAYGERERDYMNQTDDEAQQ